MTPEYTVDKQGRKNKAKSTKVRGTKAQIAAVLRINDPTLGYEFTNKQKEDYDGDGDKDEAPYTPIKFDTYIPEIEGDGTKEFPYSAPPESRSDYIPGEYYLNVPNTDGTRHQWNGENMIPKPLKK